MSRSSVDHQVSAPVRPAPTTLFASQGCDQYNSFSRTPSVSPPRAVFHVLPSSSWAKTCPELSFNLDCFWLCFHDCSSIDVSMAVNTDLVCSRDSFFLLPSGSRTHSPKRGSLTTGRDQSSIFAWMLAAVPFCRVLLSMMEHTVSMKYSGFTMAFAPLISLAPIWARSHVLRVLVLDNLHLFKVPSDNAT